MFPTTFRVSKLSCNIWRWLRIPLYSESRLKLHNIQGIEREIGELGEVNGGVTKDRAQSEEVQEGSEEKENKDQEIVNEEVVEGKPLEVHSDVADFQVRPRSTPLPERTQELPAATDPRIGLVLGERLRLTGVLGAGAYGVVYSAVDLSTSEVFAVKALSKCDANGEPLDKRAMGFHESEIRLHYTASAHPNIVSMVSIIDNSECIYVVMDYYPDGDLFSSITEKISYLGDDTAIRTAFFQIIDAVEHCHRLGIYCRDLKPENILLNGSQLALTDFGVATTSPYSQDHGCGSSFYMSPENLAPSADAPPYKCAPNDVWSLGVILVNLICCRNPWKQASLEDPTYRAFTEDHNFLKTILPLSDELNNILGMIFESDPDKRIAISALRVAVARCSSFINTSFQTQGKSPIDNSHQDEAPDFDSEVEYDSS